MRDHDHEGISAALRALTRDARWLDSLQRRVAHLPVETRGRTARGTSATRGATTCR